MSEPTGPGRQEALKDVEARMRADWNARAEEDAYYYVAFGRRDQDDDEFHATGDEVIAGLEWELRRVPCANPRARRALEIGCGPGRLIKPLSRWFGEIHGVDVSDAMIQKARHRLRHVPHAHVHVGTGSDLGQFADSSFHLVYSYAVFQHIPSREVVFNYLHEAVRVLAPGGLVRCQLNGLPKTAKVYDTWSGVRISGDEIRNFCRATGLRLLALEGLDTQYMWTTWQKPELAPPAPAPAFTIRRITNAYSSEPVAPPSGRFASVSVWVDGLPASADLLTLRLEVNGLPATLTYLGRNEADGLRQLNALLPPGLPTGMVPVTLHLGGVASPPRLFRIVPAPPAVPRILAVTDGVDLLSPNVIKHRSVKLAVEEFQSIEKTEVWLGGQKISSLETFCTDPMPPRHEVNFELPPADLLPPGDYPLLIRYGTRVFPAIPLTVE